MANVINSQYLVSNGKDFDDVYHFETNTAQVKTGDGRNLFEVIEGKQVNNQNLASLKSEGKYLTTNSVGLPNGLNANLTYLLKVETVEEVVWQTLYDHVGGNVYTRCMTSLGFSAWSNGGKDVQDKINSVSDKVSNIEFDIEKSSKIIQEQQTAISNILEEMGKEGTAHNHDERYVKKDGGVYTGSVGMANNVSLVGLNNSGNAISIAKIDNQNAVIIGNTGSNLNLLSNGEATINGTTVITSENISSHIKDTGDVYQNKRNTFTDVQTIEGTGLKLKGSSSGIAFEKSDGTLVGNIVQDSSDLVMKLGNTEAFRLRSSDNAMMVNQKIILQGSNNKVWLRLGMSATDEGFGLSASQSNMFSLYDWGKGRSVFQVDRDKNIVEFTNAIKVGGKKLTIGGTAPSSGNAVGDIWIG